MRAWILGLGALLACRAPVRLDPPLDPATRSIMLVASGPAGSTVEAIDRGARPFIELHRDDDLDLHLLQYELELAALGFTSGPVTIDPEGDAFPVPLSMHHTAVLGLDAAPWEVESELPAPLAALRLARRTTFECLSQGGCLVPVRSDLAGCTTPCPAPPEPEAPLPPEPANFLPCPNGWAPIELDGVVACDPFPGGRGPCPSGEARFLGTAGCTVVGSDCGGRFAADLPSGPLHYVDPLALAGGDGTIGAPFRTIAEALAVDTAVALAVGVYDERVSLPPGASLIGACASQTVIAPSLVDPSAAITVSGGGSARLSNLGVVANGAGVLVAGSTLSLDGVQLSVPSSAPGIQLEGARLLADGVAISGGAPGASVAAGSSAVLRRLTIAGGQQGLTIVGDVTATDVSVDDMSVAGIVAYAGSLRADRLALSAVENGIVLAGAVTAAFTDLVATDVGVGGIAAHLGAQVSAARVRIERYRTYGVIAVGLGSKLTVGDLLVRDAIGRTEDEVGGSVVAFTDGLTHVERSRLVRGRRAAAFALDSGDLELIDADISDVRSQIFRAEGGRGIELGSDCGLTADRVFIHRARAHGVLLTLGSRTTATDLRVEGTLPRDGDASQGRGIEVIGGASLDGTRVALVANRSLGLYVNEAGSRSTIVDLAVTRTSSSACVGLQCSFGFDDGMAVAFEGELDVDRFAIFDNGLYGVRISGDSTLHLENGRISGQATGVQVDTRSYDLADLAVGVWIHDNARPIEVVTDN